MAVAAADLLDVVRSQALLETEQLQQLVALQLRFPTSESLAQEMVRLEWLTEFQARQLLAGKGRTLVLDQYVLLDLLGQGGMGAVYIARQRTDKRIAALKVIFRERVEEPGALKRLRSEAEAALRLSHANLATLFDFRVAGGVPILVMEFIPGTDLEQLVRQCGPLPVAEACAHVRQAAWGLQHAHEANLVHRAIKPKNLIVSEQGVVKVIDLGLSRTAHLAAETAASADLTGTPDYMPPEQWEDARRADIRSDIYSLGCTLYYLLAGEPPFAAEPMQNKRNAHTHKDAVSLTSRRPDVPPALDAVVKRMMAKEPAERFQTPAEVADALGAFTEGHNPLPSPATISQPPPLFTGTTLCPQAASRPQPLFAATTPASPSGVARLPQLNASMTSAPKTASRPPQLNASMAPASQTAATRPPKTTAKTTRDPRSTAAPSRSRSPRGGKRLTLALPRRVWLALLGAPLVALVLASAVRLVLHLLPEDRPAPAEASQETLDLGNGVKLELVRIKAGRFFMGSPNTDKDAPDNEKPQHEVAISKDFYLGKYTVTQEQYAQVMGENPSWFSRNGDGKKDVAGLETSRLPVESVSWEDAQRFCTRASELSKRRVVLPTEAQWEYACRAGTTTRYFCGDRLTNKDANFDYKLYRTRKVGDYPANAWGLYDMAGNVSQWCADGDRKYTEEKCTDPVRPLDGRRVLRGGSWTDESRLCRAASRETGTAPDSRKNSIGFRVAFLLD